MTGVVYIESASFSSPSITETPSTVTQDVNELVAASDLNTTSRTEEESRYNKAPGSSEDWMASIQRKIEEDEMVPRKTIDGKHEGYKLLNRRHSLVSRIQDGSWALSPHSDPIEPQTNKSSSRVDEEPQSSDSSPSWRWKYTFTSIHRGEKHTSYPRGLVTEQDGTVAITHASGVKEWYRNEREGIEQGFEIAERIHGDTPGHLILRGVVNTDLQAPSPRRDAIVFTQGRIQILRYAGLKVTDSQGRMLSAWLAYSSTRDGGVLDIHIDDTSAIYPLLVDPVASSAAWTFESNQASAWLGWSVSTAGDVNGDGFSDVLVGAYLYDNGQSNEGRAYVYHGSATGLGTAAAWVMENNQASSQLGFSASTAGDVNGDGYSDVILGANLFDNGESNEGLAVVYLGSASGLVTTSAWSAEANDAGSQLGDSVETAGDINGDGYSDVIVGASLFDNGSMNEGKAWVYLGSSTGLATTTAWNAESDQASAFLGVTVATAGDVNGDGYSDAIVGLTQWDNNLSNEGGAWLYLGSSSGLVTTTAWKGQSSQASANYGTSVGTAGDVNGDGYADVMVGAKNFDNTESNEGKVWVYHGSASGPSTTVSWSAEPNSAGAIFGTSSASAGDVDGDGYADVVIGAPGFTNGQSAEGGVYVYRGSSGGLLTTALWTSESNQANTEFGYAVSTAGDVNGDGYSDILIGADSWDNTESAEGRALVFYGSAGTPATTTGWRFESNQISADLGYYLRYAGDVNGDGYTDALVGDWMYDNGSADEGRAVLFYGSSSGLGTTIGWSHESNQISGGTAYGLGGAGDVNGDGYSDVIVGDVYYDNGENDEGRALVFLGSSSGLATTSAWQVEGNNTGGTFGAQMGVSASSAGDVNADGYFDVIVGAHGFDNGQNDEGKAFVYLGSTSGLATTVAWTQEGDQLNGYFGLNVAGIGDVNADGYSDIVVSSHFYDNGTTDEGKAWVYHGSASGPLTTSSWSFEPNSAAQFGNDLGPAGDVNGDGYSDLAISAYALDNGSTDEGRAYVFQGSATGLATTPAFTYEMDQLEAYVSACHSGGDVNGDGYGDVVVGSWGYDNGQVDEGRALVLLGSGSGITTQGSWQVDSDQNPAALGKSAVGNGDVNGDGYSDVLIGASNYANGQSAEGAAFLYYGNGGAGLARAPRQLNNAGNVIQIGGDTGGTSFGAKITARSPMGRSRARLVVEHKSRGTSFANSSLQYGSWTDLGTGGTELTKTITGLTGNTPLPLAGKNSVLPPYELLKLDLAHRCRRRRG